MLEFTSDELDAINELVKDAFRENLGSKNYTGKLSDSVKVIWDDNDQAFDITFLDYGLNFNNPETGKWPNVGKIRKWVVDRGLINASEKPYKIDQVAFLVGRKIHDKGVDPFDILSPIFEKLTDIAGFVSQKVSDDYTNQLRGRIMKNIEVRL